MKRSNWQILDGQHFKIKQFEQPIAEHMIT